MSDLLLVLILFALPFIFYGVVRLFKRCIRWRRWKLAEKKALTVYDRRYLEEKFYPYAFLSAEEKIRLEQKIRYFLANKHIEGIGGLAVTDQMRLLVAAHACLILVNIETDEVYPGLANVYLMPSGYIEKDNPVNRYSGKPMHVPKLGESWKKGPIILSWDAIHQNDRFRQQRQNIIYHEFSHQLDQQDGYFDGTPEMETKNQYQLWANVMGSEFRELRRLVGRQRNSDIDSYGALNEAEFFAVCTEYFFTDSESLRIKHPELFELFRSYFKINPQKWQ